MTTIPCFAAVATAKAELGNERSYKMTLLFWLAASYIVAAMVYTMGTWLWTIPIWIAVIALIVTLIVLRNKKAAKQAV